jgi:DNA-binding transcriptional LysR family regulator
MACFLGETDPVLQRFPGLPRFSYRPIWVLTHPDLRHVPRIRAFVDFATKEIRQLRPLFEGRDV